MAFTPATRARIVYDLSFGLPPFGHDLVTQCLHVHGWSQAKELSPEALFPGRRLPAIALAQARRAGLLAREKSPSSVPLWRIFNQASSGRHNAEQIN